MADVSTIECRSCGLELSNRLMLCSGCGRNPRVAPEVVGGAVGEPHAADHSASAPAGSSPSSGLVRVTLPNHEQIVLRPGQRVILGRESPDAVVADAFPDQLEDVSRHHVRIVNDDDGVALIMLGDTGGAVGGTFLGGRRLPNNQDLRVQLQHGERFCLGALAWCKVEVLS